MEAEEEEHTFWGVPRSFRFYVTSCCQAALRLAVFESVVKIDCHKFF